MMPAERVLMRARPLRIAILAGCLEPGRDGVGDYTHGLAVEALAAGVKVLTVALADRFASEATLTEREGVPVLRLPARMTWQERLARLRVALDDFAPDWVSLQFVPYSFHAKGLAWKFANDLRPIVTKRRVHVMFHELWIGGDRGANLKERLVGTLQRVCIFRLLRSIRPQAISTSNAPYQALLRAGGYDADLLPMFGSIPFAAKAEIEWLYEELRRAGVPAVHRDQLWLFCMFGSLHPIWPPEPLVQYLLEAGEQNGRMVVVLSVGKLGPGEPLWEQLRVQYAGRLHFVRLGERSTDEVSAVLQTSDFGLATSPWELIGKSSSVASLLEHGLPVIVNRDEVRFHGGAGAEVNDPLLVKMDAQLPERLAGLLKAPPRTRLPAVAQDFLHLLVCTSTQPA